MNISRQVRTRSRARRRAALLESLEQRVLLSSSPTGSLDVFTSSQISGWAFNGDDGAAAVEIDITINGVKSTLMADSGRMDLTPTLGSPYHGFTFDVPILPQGKSTVLVEAVSPTTGVRKKLRSGALTNPAPAGKIQTANATRIAGWVYDPDVNGPVTLRLDVDGVTGTPFTANIARPDIATPRKYNTTLLGFDIAGSFAGHVVELFAVDAPTGTTRLLYVKNTKPTGKLEVNDGYTVSGWAVDPNNPAAAVSILVTIDGVALPGTPTPATGDRPDLLKKYGSTNHGYSITIPGLTPGKHTIAVYALDAQASSQAPVRLGCRVVKNAAPVGKVEVADSATVSGWALDPDVRAASAAVHVYVDQQFYATVTADTARLDIKKKYGSANHGFSVDLSDLPEGSHAITVTVDDNRASDQREVVIFDGFINNHTPVGSFDTVTGSTITGWAFDQDAPDVALPIDVYVDGNYVTTFTADQPRSDVDATLPTPNHAFVQALPAMGFGTHRIDLYAAESQGNVSVLIGSKTVTNNRPVGAVESSNATTITGWAADYDLPGESAVLRVYINGTLAISAATDVARPDVAALGTLAGAPDFNAYGFSITLPTLAAGYNQIDVYVVDANNGLLTTLGSSAVTI